MDSEEDCRHFRLDSIWDEDLRFRFLVADVAHQLHEENKGTLIFTYQLPPTFKEKSKLEVLEKLQMMGIFSPSTVMDLVELLKSLHRMDLAKFVEKWMKKDSGKNGKSDHQGEGAKLSRTAKCSLLKTQYEHIYKHTTQLEVLVEHAEKLHKDLAEGPEAEGEDHWQENKLRLSECREYAGGLARTTLALLDSFKTAPPQVRTETRRRKSESPSRIPLPSRKGTLIHC